LFDLQKKSFDVQNKLITAKNMPRVSLFFQGGLGRPALNMLVTPILQGYYIGGLRLNWNLTGFYTYNKEKKILAVNQRFHRHSTRNFFVQYQPHTKTTKFGYNQKCRS
jgi:hypothetical protein